MRSSSRFLPVALICALAIRPAAHAQAPFRLVPVQRYGAEDLESQPQLTPAQKSLSGAMIGHAGGMAEGNDGTVYVVDTRLHKVIVFNRNGTLRRVFGQRGQGPGEFQFPRSIAVAPNGELFVLDMQLSRMSVFDTAGVFRRSFAIPPNSFHVHIANNQVIVDGAIRPGRPSVHIYSPAGVLVREAATPTSTEAEFGKAGEGFNVGFMNNGVAILASPEPGVWSPLLSSGPGNNRPLHTDNQIKPPASDPDMFIARYSSRGIGQLADGRVLTLFVDWDLASFTDFAKARVTLKLAAQRTDGTPLGALRLGEGTGAIFKVAREGKEIFLYSMDPFPQITRYRVE